VGNLNKHIRKKELCVKLVIYKNYTEMHGQQNMSYDIAYRAMGFSLPVNSLCTVLDYLALFTCIPYSNNLCVRTYRVSIKSFPDYKQLLQENYSVQQKEHMLKCTNVL